MMYQPTSMMLDAIDMNFGCPQLGDAEVDSLTAVKAAFRELADFLVHHTPYCQEQVRALRHLAAARTEAIDSLAPLKVAKHRNQLAQAAQ